SPFIATRYHSLIVDRPAPDAFEVSAETADGVIMGLRHRQYPLEGIQFHPESILTGEGKRLLGNFLGLLDGLVRNSPRGSHPGRSPLHKATTADAVMPGTGGWG